MQASKGQKRLRAAEHVAKNMNDPFGTKFHLAWAIQSMEWLVLVSLKQLL